MKLNADLNQIAKGNINQIDWEPSPAHGVHRRRLECDDDQPPIERVTTVVRFAPGSAFKGHAHPGGEEFLVLDGVFSDQHADYPQGYYVRNPVGTGHAPHSEPGCTILVKLWQMRADDRTHLAIDTHNPALWQSGGDGVAILPLYSGDHEDVCMLKWEAGTLLAKQQFDAGVEYFVVRGAFDDEQGRHSSGGWLRLPPATRQTIRVCEDTLVYRKSGHLRKPVPYAQR